MSDTTPQPAAYPKGHHPNTKKNHFQKGNPGPRAGRSKTLTWKLTDLLLGKHLRGQKMPGNKSVQEVIAENLLIGAVDVNSKHHQFCMGEVLKRYAPVIVQGSMELRIDEGDKVPVRKWTEEELTKVVEIYTEARYASGGHDPESISTE